MPIKQPALLAAGIDSTLRLHHARTMAREPAALEQPYIAYIGRAQPERSAEDAAAAFRSSVRPDLMSVTVKASGETVQLQLAPEMQGVC